MRDLYHICKHGSLVKFITPYWTSEDAYEDPTHVRFLSEHSWEYFSKSFYQRNPNTDYGVDYTFDIENVTLMVRPEFLNDPNLAYKVKHELNVVQHMETRLRVNKLT